jgi:hypothetical protein
LFKSQLSDVLIPVGANKRLATKELKYEESRGLCKDPTYPQRMRQSHACVGLCSYPERPMKAVIFYCG